MKNKFLLAAITLSWISLLLYAQPPSPESGKRWILNDQFSDEFNGTSLDAGKWNNYHPRWIGREPAIFLPSQVSVSDGLLRIKNKKLEQDTLVNGSIFTIGGGAVTSKKETSFGYYECSMKASKIRMSSTFWMSGKGYPGPEPCDDKYSLEIDIQECVGGFTEGSKFRTAMNSNSHYKYTPCEGEKENYSRGNTAYLEQGEVSDTFQVYGAYWKDENEVDLYLNGKPGGTIAFRTDFNPKPFDTPLQINMVTETYNWVRPLPTDEDLADDSRNTTYYDWIRSYSLVDIDYSMVGNAIIQNPGFETGDFSSWVGWGGHPREVVSDIVNSGNYAVHIVGPGAPEYSITLQANTAYRLSCYCRVASGNGFAIFGIKDSDENYLGTLSVSDTVYTYKEFTFTTMDNPQVKFYFYAPGSGVEGWADDFNLVPLEEPPGPNIFNERISYRNTPETILNTRNPAFEIEYMTNQDSEIDLSIYNHQLILSGQETIPALAGFGADHYELGLDSMLQEGSYTIVAVLKHEDDTLSLDTAVVNLQRSVNLEITVLNGRDDSPVENATVTIGDSSKSTQSEGRVIFPAISPGIGNIRIRAEEYEDLYLENVSFINDTSITAMLFPQKYNVAFKVKDEKEGSYLEGAILQINEEERTTNNIGTAYYKLYKDKYAYKVSYEKYESKNDTVSIESDTTFSINLNKILVDAKFIVSLDSTRLSGAQVAVGNKAETTSVLGIANIRDLKVDSLYGWSIIYESETLLDSSLRIFSDTSIRHDIYTLGVQLAKFGHKDIYIYPNPVRDQIFIEGLRNDTEYKIRDLTGRTIQVGRIGPGEMILVNKMTSGLYVLSISGQEKVTFVKKK